MKEKNKYVWDNPYGKLVFWGSFVLTIFSIFYIYLSKKGAYKEFPEAINIGDAIIYAFWIVVPPFYFLVEYLWLFPDEFKGDEKKMNDFKHVQELSAKVWAGLVVVLSAVLYAKYNELFKT